MIHAHGVGHFVALFARFMLFLTIKIAASQTHQTQAGKSPKNMPHAGIPELFI
jgi:hypothetical protein